MGGSYFFNYFEFLLLSVIQGAVCQSQLKFPDSPFIFKLKSFLNEIQPFSLSNLGLDIIAISI